MYRLITTCAVSLLLLGCESAQQMGRAAERPAPRYPPHHQEEYGGNSIT
jgi:hypothetical protein